jgi:hypothetical protein
VTPKKRTASGLVPVYLERTERRTFAVTVDWPGWARAGRTPEAALDALAEYLPRYLTVVRAAGQRPPGDGPDGPAFSVVETVPGNATTTFGAPGVVPALDAARWSADAAERQVALVAACWTYLDEVAAAAPAELTKGPRGGGRDRDTIVRHVQDAEVAYARKIGLRVPAPGDPAQTAAFRADLLATLRGSALPDVPWVPDTARAKGWPAAYAARRIGWHVLDHAWEIEDKSDPPG